MTILNRLSGKVAGQFGGGGGGGGWECLLDQLEENYLALKHKKTE